MKKDGFLATITLHYTLISRGEAALSMARADPEGQHEDQFKRTLSPDEWQMWAFYERCKARALGDLMHGHAGLSGGRLN